MQMMVASIPLVTVGPIEAVVFFAELMVGTALFAVVFDLMGSAIRGYVGTTFAIAAAIGGIGLLLAPTFSTLLPVIPGAPGGSAFGKEIATTMHWYVWAFVAVVFGAVAAIELQDRARRVLGIGVGAVLVLFLAHLVGTVSAAFQVGWHGWFTMGSGTVILGAVLGGMLMGHWYLVAPGMSFRPLRQTVIVIFIAIAGAVATMVAAFATSPPKMGHAVLAYDGGWLFWLLTVGSLVGFTTVVNSLTWHFTKMRANQPATAMLYGLIVAVCIGVISAHVLMFQTGVPV